MNLLKPQQDSEPEEALETAMAMVASALSDSSRVSILCALMDGRAWTATELSTVAEVSASTTSGHLARLLSNGLVVCLAQGRHRYYRLAGSHIAGLLENLMGVSMQAHKTLLPSTPVNLRYARTCYDHLAGELAVNIYEFMLREKWLAADGLALTSAGKTQLERLGAVFNARLLPLSRLERKTFSSGRQRRLGANDAVPAKRMDNARAGISGSTSDG